MATGEFKTFSGTQMLVVILAVVGVVVGAYKIWDHKVMGAKRAKFEGLWVDADSAKVSGGVVSGVNLMAEIEFYDLPKGDPSDVGITLVRTCSPSPCGTTGPGWLRTT